MRSQDIRILEREARGLDAASEDLVGVLVQVLVEGITPGDIHGEGRLFAAPGSAPLLPDGGDAPRIPAAHRRVQRTHVHAQLQGVRRDDAEEFAAEKAALYLAAFADGVAGAVGGDAPRQLRPQPVGGVAVDQLSRLAALGKGYRPDPRSDE